MGTKDDSAEKAAEETAAEKAARLAAKKAQEAKEGGGPSGGVVKNGAVMKKCQSCKKMFDVKKGCMC